MKYFGTDGIRQKATDFTPELLNSIILGLVDYAGNEIKVFLAGDTRESSEWIIRDLEIALESLGIEYASAGILSTPAINFCFYEMGFDFAIDVTASHNPFSDNGIKIFERGQTSGQKLSKAGCTVIEKAILANKPLNLTSTTPRTDLHKEALEIYLQHLLDYVGVADFSNLHLGMDCANGATSVIGATIFEQLGAQVTLINCCKNYNTKINQACGSTHLESLQNLVIEKALDFGVAFDGDGDRVLLVDQKGNIVDGDEILAILANFLHLDSLATTVMANQGLLKWLEENHFKFEITPVGDTHVATAMREKAIPLGGEQSGHIILPNETTGDGMLTALMLTKAIAESQKSLRNLADTMQKFPQVLLNLPATPDQKLLLDQPKIKTLIHSFEEKLTPISGRLLLRPSGTENLIRISVWGNNEQEIIKLANDLKDALIASF